MVCEAKNGAITKIFPLVISISAKKKFKSSINFFSIPITTGPHMAKTSGITIKSLS